MNDSTARALLPPLRLIEVDNQAMLDGLIAGWLMKNVLAIDTEFMRTNTYHPIVGLIQLTDNKATYLIDPQLIPDLHGIAKVLSSPHITKVMHSMGEDIELFSSQLDVHPQRVFDTQIAAALLGMGNSISYQGLIEQLFSIGISKAETRSDWLNRPLSESQKQYAALDVHYLFYAYQSLVERLKLQGREGAVIDETSRLITQQLDEVNQPETAYLKLRGGWRLNQQQQFVLQKLCWWREQRAQADNIPRPHVIKDVQLLEVMKRAPKTLEQLSQIEDIKPNTIRKYGDIILSIIDRYHTMKSADELLNQPIKGQVDIDWPTLDQVQWEGTITAPLRGQPHEFYKRLKSAAATVATQQNIAIELLASKKLLQSVVRLAYSEESVETADENSHIQLPEAFCGWRYPLVGHIFEQLIRENNPSDSSE